MLCSCFLHHTDSHLLCHSNLKAAIDDGRQMAWGDPIKIYKNKPAQWRTPLIQALDKLGHWLGVPEAVDLSETEQPGLHSTSKASQGHSVSSCFKKKNEDGHFKKNNI